MILNLSAPRLLTAEHDAANFSCGEASLDEWLRRRALSNQETGASRTFVVADENGQVFAYYAMAAGAIAHRASPGKVRRNMPDPVPVMVLARLAVDQRAQGHQLGGAMLKDALQRTVRVAQDAGVRALLVHALNDRARAFYRHYGFIASPVNEMTLMLPINLNSSH